MKTLNEVIKALELCSTDDNPCDKCPYTAFDKNGVWACSMCGDFAEDALHYLRGYREVLPEYAQMKLDAVKNDPLTWDELKQMEGKPVWVEKKHSELYHMWGLVARIKRYQGHEYAVIKCPDLCNSPMSNIRLYDTMYLNDGWQAYRKERDENGN